MKIIFAGQPVMSSVSGRQATRALPVQKADTVDLRFAASPKLLKVGIIGAGNVGESAAENLVQRGVCREIAYLDIDGNRALAKSKDLAQAASVNGKDVNIVGGSDYSILKDSDVVVVTAGSPRKPGQSRDDLLEKSTRMMVEISKKIAQEAPNATIIMVSNPLDVMCYVAQKITGFPHNRIVGMAGVLDSARFQTAIAQELKVPASKVIATIIGEHGNSMVALPNLTWVKGKPLSQMLPHDKIKELIDKAKNGGAEIVNLLGTSGYKAPGAAIAKMIANIQSGKKESLPAAAYLNGEYGVKGIYIGVPTYLGPNGVEQILDESSSLTAEEKKEFDASVAAVQANVVKADAILAKIDQENSGQTAKA